MWRRLGWRAGARGTPVARQHAQPFWISFMPMLAADSMERHAAKKSAVVQALATAICHELVELRCDVGADAFGATRSFVLDTVGATLESMRPWRIQRVTPCHTVAWQTRPCSMAAACRRERATVARRDGGEIACFTLFVKGILRPCHGSNSAKPIIPCDITGRGLSACPPPSAPRCAPLS